MKRQAFTLIELLVVIAIIALLAAILFPVFGRARENARRSSCASNQKQIGTGLIQYAQDYDERMPLWPKNGTTNVKNAENFMDPTAADFKRNPFYAMLPYLKSTQVFACPSAKADTSSLAPTNLSDVSYLPSGTALEIHIARHPAPSELVFVQEHQTRYSRLEMRPEYVDGSGGIKFRQWAYTPTSGPQYSNTHFDGGNLMYVDGHVKWMKNSNLRASMWGLGPATATCSGVSGTANDNSKVGGDGRHYCVQF